LGKPAGHELQRKLYPLLDFGNKDTYQVVERHVEDIDPWPNVDILVSEIQIPSIQDKTEVPYKGQYLKGRQNGCRDSLDQSTLDKHLR